MQSITQKNSLSDPILTTIDRTRQQLQDIVTASANEPITTDRNKALERQLKDLARYDAELEGQA